MTSLIPRQLNIALSVSTATLSWTLMMFEVIRHATSHLLRSLLVPPPQHFRPIINSSLGGAQTLTPNLNLNLYCLTALTSTLTNTPHTMMAPQRESFALSAPVASYQPTRASDQPKPYYPYITSSQPTGRRAMVMAPPKEDEAAERLRGGCIPLPVSLTGYFLDVDQLADFFG